MATTLATATSSRNTAHTVNWGRYALVGLGTIVAAVLANVLVYYLGGALAAYDPRFPPLSAVSGAVIFTVVPAIAAAILYAILLRFARRPARIFAIIAAVAFVVTAIPDFTYAPRFPGATGGQIAILVTMHIVAAVVIVGLLTRFSGGQER